MKTVRDCSDFDTGFYTNSMVLMIEDIAENFSKYEAEGFAPYFHNKNSKYDGETFTVIGRAEMDECIEAGEPMWNIRFSNGIGHYAFMDEIFSSNIKGKEEKANEM